MEFDLCTYKIREYLPRVTERLFFKLFFPDYDQGLNVIRKSRIPNIQMRMHLIRKNIYLAYKLRL